MTNHRTHIFTGPTLSHKKALQLCPNANIHPPVRCGDLISILSQQPDRVVIIDGFFELTPSIWHKEILYLIELGIDVIGTSSMGALRAAELHTLGMRGMGVIFQMYRDKLLCDDDEVAVAHYSEKLQYFPCSDAMINIRMTLQQAVKEGILSKSISQQLIQDAKQTFYWQRNLEQIIHGSQISTKNKEALRIWLPKNEINQKEQDAINTLTTINNTPPSIPKKTPFEPSIQVFNLIKTYCSHQNTSVPPGILIRQSSILLMILHLIEPSDARILEPKQRHLLQQYQQYILQFSSHNPKQNNALNTPNTLIADMKLHWQDYTEQGSLLLALSYYPMFNATQLQQQKSSFSAYYLLRQQLWHLVKALYEPMTQAINPDFLHRYTSMYQQLKSLTHKSDIATLQNQLQISDEQLQSALHDLCVYKQLINDSRISNITLKPTTTSIPWSTITNNLINDINTALANEQPSNTQPQANQPVN